MRKNTKPTLGTWFRLGAAGAAIALVSGCSERPLGPGSESDGNVQSTRPPIHSLGGGAGPDKPPLPASEYELVGEVAPGRTAEDIALEYQLWVIDEIPGTPYALFSYLGYEYEALADELVSSGACKSCDRNYWNETPEALQGSIAFYEGNLTETDFEDQDALIRVRANQAHHYENGSGVTVAVLDTGVDPAHPDFAGALVPGWDFVQYDAMPWEETPGWDRDEDGLYDEAAGHGTHVAGIVLATAPGANLMPVRVLDSEGRGTAWQVAAGIWHAVQHGADVINLSLGFTGTSRVMNYALSAAKSAGVTVVSSAGNANQVGLTYPARLASVLGVVALDANDQKASFSNFADNAAVGAPGVGIVSTYLHQGYAVWSGTSMAAPFVSGAAAIAIAGGATTRHQVKLAILHAASGYSPGDPFAPLLGSGRVDLLPVATPVYVEAGPNR